jgi:hypothetical protein
MRSRPLVSCSVLFLLVLEACRSTLADPAPAPASYELVAAPPGARGARAAGTDAAPPPPSALGAPDPDEPGDSDDSAEGGADVDAGTVAPDPDGGVAL